MHLHTTHEAIFPLDCHSSRFYHLSSFVWVCLSGTFWERAPGNRNERQLAVSSDLDASPNISHCNNNNKNWHQCHMRGISPLRTICLPSKSMCCLCSLLSAVSLCRYNSRCNLNSYIANECFFLFIGLNRLAIISHCGLLSLCDALWHSNLNQGIILSHW